MRRNLIRDYTSAAGIAITTTYQTFAIDGLPSSCLLGTLAFEQTAEAGAPTSVTGYLCRDSNGDVPITPEFTALLQDGVTAGEGGFAISLDGRPYKYTTDNTAVGRIYARLKVNVATSATGKLRLIVEE